MTTELMTFAYLTPLVGILGMFWNVARKLGNIETEVKQLRHENKRLESDVHALRMLMTVVVDSRRQTA